MRIEELSVGDWVQVEEQPFKVIGIEKWRPDYVVILEGANRVETLGKECLSPIHVTPEILEKNGFEKNGEYDEWNIGTWRTPYLLGVLLERPAITVKWNGSSIFIDQAKYVHQLQHALRLAGVQKEIEI